MRHATNREHYRRTNDVSKTLMNKNTTGAQTMFQILALKYIIFIDATQVSPAISRIVDFQQH